MTRYGIKPHQVVRAAYDEYMWTSDGRCEGQTVHDTGGWSEDQPTGLLDADGNMIYRLANRIGFLADN